MQIPDKITKSDAVVFYFKISKMLDETKLLIDRMEQRMYKDCSDKIYEKLVKKLQRKPEEEAALKRFQDRRALVIDLRFALGERQQKYCDRREQLSKGSVAKRKNPDLEFVDDVQAAVTPFDGSLFQCTTADLQQTFWLQRTSHRTMNM